MITAKTESGFSIELEESALDNIWTRATHWPCPGWS